MRGTVIQRGRRWSAVVDLPRGEDGRRRRQWFSGFKLKKEAEAKLAEVLSSVQTGDHVAPSRGTLAAYLREWLNSARATVRPSTWASYKGNLEVHVIPRLGGVPLQGLTTAQLNGLYADLLEAGRRRNGQGGGLSPRTVRYVHTIVHRALGDAVKWRRLARNAATGASAPKPATPEMRVWTGEQLRAFLDHVRDDRLYAAYLTASQTALRRGELLALRWQDVDLENGRLSITQTLIAVGYRVSTSEPKTKRSKRSIAVDPVTLATLRAHRRAQLQERLRWGADWQDTGLVFCREDGSHVHPDRFTDWFKEHVRAAGVPKIRLHDLRHTWATLALQAGIHPKVVSERLGHSNISITLDTYSHTIPAQQEEAAAKVSRLVFG